VKLVILDDRIVLQIMLQLWQLDRLWISDKTEFLVARKGVTQDFISMDNIIYKQKKLTVNY